jgi:hypothetical protein
MPPKGIFHNSFVAAKQEKILISWGEGPHKRRATWTATVYMRIPLLFKRIAHCRVDILPSAGSPEKR